MLSRRGILVLAGAAVVPSGLLHAQLPAAANAKLRRICGATITSPNLGVVEDWYAGALGYRVTQRTTVSPQLAVSWGVPAMAGRAMISMVPENGGDVPIRAVAIDPIAPAKPLTAWGWSAIEIAVRDLDALYAKLRSGWLKAPIEVLGEPHPSHALRPDSPINAMQVRGPAGEVLYLTANTGDRAASNHPEPRSQVDRPFIAVLAGPDFSALKSFYMGRFALADQGDQALPVPSRAKAHGLPEDHVYKLGVVVAAERGNKIELDEFPRGATGPQPRKDGQLPPGTAIMSFSVAGFDGLDLPFFSPPAAVYGSTRAATFRGPAGELTELTADRA